MFLQSVLHKLSTTYTLGLDCASDTRIVFRNLGCIWVGFISDKHVRCVVYVMLSSMRYGMVEQGNSNLHASLLMPEHAMATVFLWHSLSYNIHQDVVCLTMCYLIHVLSHTCAWFGV